MIVAKFKCDSVTKHAYGGEEVKFGAVYGPGNEEWSKATPTASLEMVIDNPAAQGQFEPGKDYLVRFEPAPAEA